MKRRQEPPRSSLDPIHTSDDFPYVQFHTLLRELSNELSGQSSGVIKHLCQKITAFTLGYASLRLYQKPPQQIENEHFSTSWLRYSVPVQCVERDYGHLIIIDDPTQSLPSWLTPSTAQIIGDWCANLLYQLETILFFRHHTNIDFEKVELLRPREQEVLELMCQGYGAETIAQMLTIDKDTVRTHRGNLYSRLHVRSELQAIIAGFATALYSPIEGLAPRRYPSEDE